ACLRARVEGGEKSTPVLSPQEGSDGGTAPVGPGQTDARTARRGAHGATSAQGRGGGPPAGGAGRRGAGGRGVRGHRLRVPRRRTAAGPRRPARRPGEPEKKGYVGCSVTCPHCAYAAKFHSYQ